MYTATIATMNKPLQNYKCITRNLIIATAKRSVAMKCEATREVETDKYKLKNVLLVPELTKNLFSVDAVTQNGGVVKCTENKVEVLKNNATVMESSRGKDGLYLTLRLPCRNHW